MPRLSLLLLLLSFTFFTACTEENKEIFEAQACLDRATPATAMSCAEKVSGKNNQRAYVITCGARFLARGLDEQKIAAALEEISDDTGGTDPTSTAIANLAVMDDFENPTNFDQAFADETLRVCQLTGSDGLSALASFSSVATTVGALSTAQACIDGSGDGYEVDVNCITAELDSAGDTDATSLGATARANQELWCGENGIFKDETFCFDVNAAVGAGGTDDDIGDALLAGIANDND
jgi:hypothetical protein